MGTTSFRDRVESTVRFTTPARLARVSASRLARCDGTFRTAMGKDDVGQGRLMSVLNHINSLLWAITDRAWLVSFNIWFWRRVSPRCQFTASGHVWYLFNNDMSTLLTDSLFELKRLHRNCFDSACWGLMPRMADNQLPSVIDPLESVFDGHEALKLWHRSPFKCSRGVYT